MEKYVITLMRFDVVNDGCGYHLITLEMELAQRLLLKLVISQPIPSLGVI